MNKSMVSAFVIASLVGASAAWADEPGEPESNNVVQGAEQQQMPPPPPPESVNPPPPPVEQQQYAPQAAAPAQATPDGQWVYTDQYGWLWMPYEQSYTYVNPDAAAAYMYVYYPTFGWRWVGSPWVLGYGASPRWGAYGPARFAFHAHPWFRAGTAYRGYNSVGYAHAPVGHASFGHASVGVHVSGGHGGGGFRGGGGHGRR